MNGKKILLNLVQKKLSKLLTTLTILLPMAAFGNLSDIHTQLTDDYQTRLNQRNESLSENQQSSLENRKQELTSQVESLRAQMEQLLAEMTQLDSELKHIATLEQPPQYFMSTSDWDSILSVDSIERCRFKARNKENFYTISNDRGEEIRFKPIVEENSSFRSQATLHTTGSEESPIHKVQISQIAYSLENQDLVNMEASLDYQIVNDQIVYGHVSFLGQKINDRSFSRSSYDPLRIICKTGVVLE